MGAERRGVQRMEACCPHTDANAHCDEQNAMPNAINSTTAMVQTQSHHRHGGPPYSGALSQPPILLP